MHGFHDVLFPVHLARAVRCAPGWTTDIRLLGSGREIRTAQLAHSRRRYEILAGERPAADLAALAAFFEARRGRLFGFRFRDPLDHASCPPHGAIAATDQALGIGDGARTDFALVKAYGDDRATYLRPIARPVAGTISVSVAGVELAASAWSCDAATGLVRLAQAAPAGAQVRAGFLFDTPVRFDAERLDVTIADDGAARFGGVELIEVAP